MRVYLSSTFEDLEAHRAAAARAIRRLGHQVVQMEDYGSANVTPLRKVVDDVRGCDAFVGLYAWKCGSIPPGGEQDKPPKIPDATLGESSFTEWELAAARQGKLTVLLFLLEESAPWPPHFIDGFEKPAAREPIRELRDRIRRSQLVSHFQSPEELEQAVATSIAASETTRQLRIFLVRPAVFQDEHHFSLQSSDTDAITKELENITSDVVSKSNQRTIKFNLTTGWWCTRLFLLAFMAERLTGIRRILITETVVDSDPNEEAFVGLLPTETAVAALLAAHPILKKFVSRSGSPKAPIVDMSQEIQDLMGVWFKCFSAKTPESDIAQHMSAADLARWFGHAMLRRPLSIRDVRRPTLLELALVMNYPHEFVPVAWLEEPKTTGDNPPVGPVQRFDVVEQADLSQRIAQRFVNDQLGRIVMHGMS